MTRRTWQEAKQSRLMTMTPDEHAEYERGYRMAALQAAIGEQVRLAREDAGMSQRDLAQKMGTSQAAIARLEAGGVGATVTTLQRAAEALGLTLTVSLNKSAA
jgi:ribosome-binding protein aMBF1 (putative translation factor)